MDDSAPTLIPTSEGSNSLVIREHLRRGGGRGRLPDHLPREVVDHELSDTDKPCPCCGETRQRIGCETSEQLEFVPAALKVIEHRRWKYACRRCEEQVIIAPVPNKPIAKGPPGPGLLSSVVVSKYADHLPLYRLEDIFARSGVELSRGTLCRWAMQAAAILEPVYQAMIARVRSSESRGRRGLSMTTKQRKRHSPEQIVRKPRDADTAQSRAIAAKVRRAAIADCDGELLIREKYDKKRKPAIPRGEAKNCRLRGSTRVVDRLI